MQGNGEESPPALPAGGAPERSARAFGGRAEDLDIDFAALPRPVAVTEVLRRSFRRDAAEIWSWTLPERSQALIAVALATADERLECHARCPETSCAEMMEWEIALAAFLSGAEDPGFDWSPEPGRTLHISLPTGEDQKTWLERGEVAPAVMARRLVQSVDGRAPAVGWRLPKAWIEGLATELGRRDPLTADGARNRSPLPRVRRRVRDRVRSGS
jgi:hypothetical protein